MAYLVRPWVVRWIDPATKKRVPAGTPGAKKLEQRSKKWYGVGVPGYGKKRVPLATDKAASRRMLDNLIRATEQGQAGIPDADAGRKRLADHLAEFEQDMAAGLAGRGPRGRTRPDPRQVKLTVQRIGDVLDGCEFKYVGDLNDGAPLRLATHLKFRADLSRKAGGFSHQTAAFYLAAARRFVWWLSVKKRAPVPVGLFDSIPGFDPDNHRKHARRNVTPDELARVLDAARGGEEAEGLSGEARYHLYLAAFATGFRAAELASLQPESFDLAADPPVVRLAGKASKNKKAATQPLPPGVAAQLATFLATTTPGEPIWPGKWRTHAARMLRVDLAAAGVPYSVPGTNGPAFADFHALRHSFLSALAAANVGPKVLQELARHSTARLTLEKYTHADRGQLAGAVAKLTLGGADAAGAITRDQLAAGLILAAGLLGWILGPTATIAATTPPKSTKADTNTGLAESA